MDGTAIEGFSKRCGCGRVFDRRAWLALPLGGLFCAENESLELRTCRCGSTIAVPWGEVYPSRTGGSIS